MARRVAAEFRHSRAGFSGWRGPAVFALRPIRLSRHGRQGQPRKPLAMEGRLAGGDRGSPAGYARRLQFDAHGRLVFYQLQHGPQRGQCGFAIAQIAHRRRQRARVWFVQIPADDAAERARQGRLARRLLERDFHSRPEIKGRGRREVCRRQTRSGGFRHLERRAARPQRSQDGQQLVSSDSRRRKSRRPETRNDHSEDKIMNDPLSRRSFLQRSGLVGAGVTAAQFLPLRFLQAQQATDDVLNPLAHYPNRNWEQLYRNQYAYDHVFSWVCAPNDTHNCRINAHVRNGIIVRLGEQYDVHTYTDLYGKHASAAWGNRHCAKGYTFHRILYGPYRLKHPIVRRGWKRWADDGFPPLTAEVKAKYKFDTRGTDKFERISWDDAFAYIAKATKAIASRYSGEAGAQLLEAQGYPKEMIEDMGGAGTRTIKMRGGMGLLGVLGKYGMYRLCNSLALLHVAIRGVKPEEAKAGRVWSNYTWHGDQAPGHPWVHGLQNSESDFNDLRSARLIIMNGKNLVENKMADAHWFIECMERGAKIVVIAPEYGAPSTKAAYWVPVRPARSD